MPAEKRLGFVGIRLRPWEADLLKTVAADRGVTLSEYARRILIADALQRLDANASSDAAAAP